MVTNPLYVKLRMKKLEEKDNIVITGILCDH